MMAETKTLTPVEFLEARLAEDEAVARAASGSEWRTDPHHDGVWGGHEALARYAATWNDGDGYSDAEPVWPDTAEHMARQDPARVLRDVAAKRAIMATAEEIGDEPPAGWVWQNAILYALATVYADHPDYRREWRML